MTDLPHDHLERRLARTLGLGTWIGSTVIAVGFLASLRLPIGGAIEMAGVAIFIALPVLRLALMLATFARRQEWAFAATAALVLLIIAISAASSAKPADGAQGRSRPVQRNSAVTSISPTMAALNAGRPHRPSRNPSTRLVSSRAAMAS
jgi:hypothetical protein